VIRLKGPIENTTGGGAVFTADPTRQADPVSFSKRLYLERRFSVYGLSD